MTLWFENSFGDRREIAQCDNWVEVYANIRKFIDKCNEAKRSGKPFEWYYTRVWEEDGMTKIDVGSHSEFFYWEGKYTNE